MDEELAPLTHFGRLVLPFSWYSTTNPQDPSSAIIGFQNAPSAGTFDGEVTYDFTFDPGLPGSSAELTAIEFYNEFSGADNFTVTSEAPNTSGVVINVITKSGVDRGGIISAFNATYGDINTGGGNLSFSVGRDAFPVLGVVDPNAPRIVIDTSMPRYNEQTINDGDHEFWGGVFVAPGTNNYTGQVNLYDTVVLPGASTGYSIQLNANGDIAITPNDPQDTLFGSSYTVRYAEEVVFGGNPLVRDDVASILSYGVMFESPPDVIEEISQFYTTINGTPPDPAELIDLLKDYLGLGASLSDVKNKIIVDAALTDGIEAIDFTDPANVQQRQQFVEKHYEIGLDRDPDAEGLAFWSGVLESGTLDQNSFGSSFFDGIFAATGGEQDQRFMSSVWEFAKRVVIEAGIQSKDIVDQAYDDLLVRHRNGELDFGKNAADEAIEEATDADGVDDSLTIGLQGIFDPPMVDGM